MRFLKLVSYAALALVYCFGSDVNHLQKDQVIGQDAEREFYKRGDSRWDSRIYYRYNDSSLGEEKVLIIYNGELAYPENSAFDKELKEAREAVLEDGQSIHFNNENGSGSIYYVSTDRRRYVITKRQQSDSTLNRNIRMIVRQNRFLGKRGLYEPASRWGFEFWAGPRMVVSEAEMHFGSLEAALKYMRVGSSVFKWVHNGQGYVVGYSESAQRNQVNVALYRYYINGKPALRMPGYDNEKLLLEPSCCESDSTRQSDSTGQPVSEHKVARRGRT